MGTDYDCWKTEPVSWDAILAVFKENTKKVTTLLIDAIPKVAGRGGVRCCQFGAVYSAKHIPSKSGHDPIE